MALPPSIQAVQAKEIVGANIRAERKRIGITQEALADRSAMHPVEIGRLERGTRDLRVSTLAKIARGLGVPASELLKGV